jgi:hypothetical protein
MKAKHGYSPNGETDNNGTNVVFEKNAFRFKEIDLVITATTVSCTFHFPTLVLF